jgi:hypothetical protein
MATATWGDYEFNVHTMEGKKPFYVGITESFKNRCPDHERWEEVQRLGATHVHARVEALEANGLAIEKKLTATFHPSLNTHHRV